MVKKGVKGMKTCTRCKGSGHLLRLIEKKKDGTKIKKTIQESFKKCTNCGGYGTKPAPYQSKFI